MRDKTMRLDHKIALAALPVALHPALAQKVVDLTGDGWTVSSKALNISVPGKLPSQVHLDLLAAKAIGEIPFALSQVKNMLADLWQMIRQFNSSVRGDRKLTHHALGTTVSTTSISAGSVTTTGHILAIH